MSEFRIPRTLGSSPSSIVEVPIAQGEHADDPANSDATARHYHASVSDTSPVHGLCVSAPTVRARPSSSLAVCAVAYADPSIWAAGRTTRLRARVASPVDGGLMGGCVGLQVEDFREAEVFFLVAGGPVEPSGSLVGGAGLDGGTPEPTCACPLFGGLEKGACDAALAVVSGDDEVVDRGVDGAAEVRPTRDRDEPHDRVLCGRDENGVVR
jgi:hypothetical protein